MSLLKSKSKSLSMLVLSMLVVASTTMQTNALRCNSFENINIDIPSVIVIDEKSGDILYGQNEDEQRPIASVTKCMTLLVVLEAIERGELSLDQAVTLKETPNSWGTRFYLEKGDTYTIDDLIHMIMLVSANDACLVLAEQVSGSVDNFVKEMNVRASQLGLKKTKFFNPNGLPLDNGDSGNLSSAKELSYLVKYIMDNYGSYVSKVVSTQELMLDGMESPRYNGNKLLFRNENNKGFVVDGFKTGYTTDAGYCLAATSVHDNNTPTDKKDDFRTISISLGGSGFESRFKEHTRMLQNITDNYSNVQLASKNEKIKDLEITNDTIVDVVTQSDLNVLAYNGGPDQFEKNIVISDEIQLPIKKGDVVGVLEFKNKSNKNIVYTVNLVSVKDANKVNIFNKIIKK